ncbi:ribonuclease Z [Ignicoccus islandicus]|uniref:ribonuclease Z n=1 Tax=Ignicoccus islandicus TaxID=54259 RepID=UPI0009466DF0|nr:ribonuclease Z [Ignicoccus islandicus]
MPKIVVLGTSAATPKPKRHLSSYYFEHEGIGILLDAGEGTQYQLMRAGIRFSKIKVVVISHLHGDHVLGLPGLIETMSMGSRREELQIIAPKGIRELLECSFKYTYFKPSFPIYIFEIEENEEFEMSIGNYVRVKVFPVNHIVPSIGTKITVGGKRKVMKEKLEEMGVPKRLWAKIQNCEDVHFRGQRLSCDEFTIPPKELKIVYSGDTAPCTRIINESENADVLIHEATFTKELKDEANERGHSTAMDAAIVASKAKVKMLVLTHFSARYENLGKFLDEAKQFFENTYLASEFMKIIVKRD